VAEERRRGGVSPGRIGARSLRIERVRSLVRLMVELTDSDVMCGEGGEGKGALLSQLHTQIQKREGGEQGGKWLVHCSAP